MVVYALVDWLVIMAPALAIQLAADRGGIGDTEGLDLLIASAVIATRHAVRGGPPAAGRGAHRGAAGRRLDRQPRRAGGAGAQHDPARAWSVLASFPDEHAALANRGYPVVGAVGRASSSWPSCLAEVTGRLVFWWLEPHRGPTGIGRELDDDAEPDARRPRRSTARQAVEA